jgi:hypothetical protein
MSTLYIVQAQPNPPGKDTVRPGFATAAQLNEEWLEFEARNGDRNLIGDVVSHLTFSSSCSVTGQDQLIKFGQETLREGQRLRFHTGSGIKQWVGGVLHVYLGRDWYVWNNVCGDRATVTFQETVVDTAGYRPRPPEGVLVRVPGTDRLERSGLSAVGWR